MRAEKERRNRHAVERNPVRLLNDGHDSAKPADTFTYFQTPPVIPVVSGTLPKLRINESGPVDIKGGY